MRMGTCAGCGREAMVNRYAPTVREMAALDIEEGEFCAACFEHLTPSRPRDRFGVAGPREDMSGGQENAVRALEGD